MSLDTGKNSSHQREDVEKIFTAMRLREIYGIKPARIEKTTEGKHN